MSESRTKSDGNSALVQRIVCEFRVDNERWVKAGALCCVPCGDMPDGVYLGPDKKLYQLCLEIRAISWEISRRRAQVGAMPSASAREFDSANAEGMDAWNTRYSDFLRFCEILMPLYESRLWQLADVAPHTLHGLARKADVIEREIMGTSDDEPPASKVLRSIFRDIASMMGEAG